MRLCRLMTLGLAIATAIAIIPVAARGQMPFLIQVIAPMAATTGIAKLER